MATLTPDVTDTSPAFSVRRPAGQPMRYPSTLPAIGSPLMLNRWPNTTTPQFTGTVDPGTAQGVYLVDRRTDTILAFASVDPITGAFSFNNAWQAPDASAEFGFQFLASNGFCSQTFPVEDPTWNQFMGNPVINDSATGARP